MGIIVTHKDPFFQNFLLTGCLKSSLLSLKQYCLPLNVFLIIIAFLKPKMFLQKNIDLSIASLEAFDIVWFDRIAKHTRFYNKTLKFFRVQQKINIFCKI